MSEDYGVQTLPNSEPADRGFTLEVSRVLPAYQQVADQLLDLILSGRLAAGDRLPPEAELATSFGVSRSTVREALRSLASRDLVETTRGTNGGTFVRRVEVRKVREHLEMSIGLMWSSDVITVREMLEAREVLEVPAARKAAERREDDHVTDLWHAIESETRSGNRSIRFREHRNFHEVIVQAAGNGLLQLMTDPVFWVLQTKFLDPEVRQSFWGSIDEDHRTIAEAIEARDGDAAAVAMQDHLVRLRDLYHDPR